MNIENITFRQFIIILKGKGVFKKLPTNGLTEAQGNYPDFPLDIRARKLGDILATAVMGSVSIQHLRQLDKVGETIIEVLTQYVQEEDDIDWPGPAEK